MTAGSAVAWRVVPQGPRPALIRREHNDGTRDVSHKVGGHVLIGGSLQRKWSERTVTVPASDLFVDYDQALAALRARRRARAPAPKPRAKDH